MQSCEVEKLKKWFLSQRRDLPWRENITPYAVWVSEIMLQQTQVAVVIPYFQRWMNKFPTIRSLASAPIEEVIKEWEGLGYYARARNLHEGAQYVVKNHGGELPETEAELRQIRGLGDYTIGAIRSFAFNHKAAAVDGNVLRVLARYYGLNDDISKMKSVKKFQGLVQSLLPEKDPWIISESLIELGATACMRVPKCLECPLKRTCIGFLESRTHELPFKAVKQATTALYRAVPIIVVDGHILVSRGEKGKVMADLFQFPYFEVSSSELDIEKYRKWVKEELKLTVDWQATLPHVKHSFTRYRALLMPQVFQTKKMKAVEGMEWHSMESVKKLPFSSGHRRVLAYVKELLG